MILPWLFWALLLYFSVETWLARNKKRRQWMFSLRLSWNLKNTARLLCSGLKKNKTTTTRLINVTTLSLGRLRSGQCPSRHLLRKMLNSWSLIQFLRLYLNLGWYFFLCLLKTETMSGWWFVRNWIYTKSTPPHLIKIKYCWKPQGRKVEIFHVLML